MQHTSPSTHSRSDAALIREALAREEGYPVAAQRAPDTCLPGLVSSYETKSTAKRAYRGEKRISRLRKAVPIAARHMSGAAQAGGFRFSVAMITLTYRPDVQWSPNHVRDFQSCIEAYLARRGLRYRAVWVIEQTQRGVPHYHVLIWLNRAHLEGRRLPKPDDRGWWPHGLTRIEWARNAIGYLVKYASKAQHATKFPKGCRLFGIRGLQGDFRRCYRLEMLPYWVKDRMGRETLCKRLTGGWWLSENGELFRSPWMIVCRAHDWSWIEFGPRVDGQEPRIERCPCGTPERTG